MILALSALASSHRPGTMVFEKDKPVRPTTPADFTSKVVETTNSKTGAKESVTVEETKSGIDVRHLKQVGVAVFGGGYDRDAQVNDANRDDRVIVVFEDRAEIMTAAGNK